MRHTAGTLPPGNAAWKLGESAQQPLGAPHCPPMGQQQMPGKRRSLHELPLLSGAKLGQPRLQAAGTRLRERLLEQLLLAAAAS